LAPPQQVESITTELTRIQERATVVSHRIQEITKEHADAQAELELLARRTIMFREKRAAIQTSIDSAAQVSAPADPTHGQLAQTTAQLAQVQTALSSLLQVLAVQAPALVQQLPPQVVAGLTTVAAVQPGAAVPPVQAEQALAPPAVVAPAAVPLQHVPAQGLETLPQQHQQPAPAQQGAAGALTAQVAQAPTPSRALGASAAGGAAGRHTSLGRATLGVLHKQTKAARSQSRTTPGDGLPAAPMEDEEDDMNSEPTDDQVQQQLATFAAMAAATAPVAWAAPVTDGTPAIPGATELGPQ